MDFANPGYSLTTHIWQLFIHVSISYPSTSVLTSPSACTQPPRLLLQIHLLLPSFMPVSLQNAQKNTKSSELSRKTHWISPPWIETAKTHFFYGDAIKESVGIGVE
jgi:hypothetical protein